MTGLGAQATASATNSNRRCAVSADLRTRYQALDLTNSAFSLPVFCAYAAWRGITGNLLIASNFFDIGTCSYLRPMPGVL
jgi:hypothetical protein